MGPRISCDGCKHCEVFCEWPVGDWKRTCAGCIEKHVQCMEGGILVTQRTMWKSAGPPWKRVKSEEAVKETEESETGLEDEGRMVAAAKTIAASLDGMREEMCLMRKTLKIIAGYTEMSAKAMGCFVRGEQFLQMWEMGMVEGEQAER